jgi:hypothetical protein
MAVWAFPLTINIMKKTGSKLFNISVYILIVKYSFSFGDIKLLKVKELEWGIREINPTLSSKQRNMQPIQ